MTHRMKRLLAAAAGTAAILTPAGIALTAGAASASTPGDGAAAGATSQIVLGNGGYAYCLNDYGQQSTGKVVLWSCGNYSSNNWVFYSDGTIRPELHPGSALSVSSSGDAVLTAVGTAPTAAQEWSYRADGALVNATPTGTPAAKETVLNDPGYVAKDGVQLISYSQAAPVTPNSHWWVKGAHYATTKLTDLPDAGLNGGFWALDTGTYAQSIVYTGTTGTSSSPAYTYEDSQMQAAGFTTMPGTPQPNGASKSARQ